MTKIQIRNGKRPIKVVLYDPNTPSKQPPFQNYECIEKMSQKDILIQSPMNIVTHIFRSVCPVTGQPDYATLLISGINTTLTYKKLLNYILSFREKPGFHETCIEKIFTELPFTGNVPK